MNSSQGNTIWSEIASDVPLSDGTLAYLEERAKNSFYNFIITKFNEAERCGFSKAKLARRINKRPDQISRMLGAPGNWTLETITALLAGISGEELLPRSESFFARSPRNCQPEDVLRGEQWGSQKPGTSTSSNVVMDPVAWKTT